MLLVDEGDIEQAVLTLLEIEKSVVEGAGATRVEVSLLVQTIPGREYRFESAVTLKLSGAGGGEALEEATLLSMEQMESRGAMYGQWRKQVVTAERLRASARRR